MVNLHYSNFNITFHLIINFVLKGFASSFSPKQDSSNVSILPQTSDVHFAPKQVPISNAPKPKKFFKSRNVVPDTIPKIPTQDIQHNQLPPSIQKIPKINKKLIKNDEASAPRTKTEKIKIKKPPKVKEKTLEKPVKLQNVEKPTRVLSRTRKTVNYSENKTPSPPPSATLLTEPCPANEHNTTQPEEFQSNDGNHQPISHNDQFSEAINSPKHQLNNSKNDHPPIVLRISKVSFSLFLFYFSVSVAK